MIRELFQIVTISGPQRVRKAGKRYRDGEEARRVFNRVASQAKADTQVRLYYGKDLVCCSGGDPDVGKGEPLDERQKRDIMRTMGENDG